MNIDLYILAQRNVRPITHGYQCGWCGKEIKLCRGAMCGDRGIGFMRISMSNHINMHIRNGDIKEEVGQ